MPTVLLKAWHLQANLFDGERLAGPVPTLFSEEPEAAALAIAGDALKAHWDLNKISKAFFMPETISIKEALAVLKKPREGAAMYAFKRPRLTAASMPNIEAERQQQQPSNRREEQQGPSSSRDNLPQQQAKRARMTSTTETGGA